MLKEEIRRSETEVTSDTMNDQDMDVEEEEDDDNEASNASEYESWKLRELGRIKKEKEARDEIEKEKQEIGNNSKNIRNFNIYRKEKKNV